jgi:hypothetical protein
MKTLLFYSRHLFWYITPKMKRVIVHYHTTATSPIIAPIIPPNPTTTLFDPLELVVYISASISTLPKPS